MPEEDIPVTETDECIVTVKCKGNCDHITCRMQTMKVQGGKRTSPADVAELRATHNCPQCNFTASAKSELDNHIKSEHGSHPNCPFCQVGFNSLSSLRKHIQENHNEVKDLNVRPSVIIQNKVLTVQTNNQICVFNLRPGGCKKGQSSEFSHETNIQQNTMVKVRKLCHNGHGCSWKPRCRYIHPEADKIFLFLILNQINL